MEYDVVVFAYFQSYILIWLNWYKGMGLKLYSLSYVGVIGG